MAYRHWPDSPTARPRRLATMADMTFKAYLVEDSPVIRENLVGFLEDVADAQVVASASTEDEAVTWLRMHTDEWDLTIVDLFLKRGNGLGVLHACRNRAPHQKVIVLSNYATPDMRERSEQLGADAFFDKSAELDELVAYCERVGASHG
ncbi:Response regulator UvrY [Variovorax paradoxus]|jgi:DNA-binding NarL/FixJ family response regulator|uniref:Response regulator UvrY n=2 Tax=Variovorax paradoxus TaxID=34073 RepID=A0A679JM30_VARPD|nr:Response regulator UvrY [Variovorax paradoxus]